MPTVVFSSDFNVDLNIIRNSFGRLKEVFGEDYFSQTFSKFYPECKSIDENEVVNYFKENKEQIMRKIKISSKQVEKQWNKINDIYFKRIEEITGFNWEIQTYKCFFSSSYVIGGGYKRPNLIFIFPLSKDIDPVILIAHELFHLHFLNIVDKMGLKLNEKDLWDLSEVVVDVVLSDLDIQGLNYKHMIYPQHKNLYNELKLLWERRKNFKEFMLNSETYISNRKS